MIDSLDALIGQWHELADRSVDQLKREFTADSLELLNDVVGHVLGSADIPEFSTPDEFATYVLELRENERAWSLQLGRVILDAQNSVENGDQSGALRAFEDFERSCPWRVFVEIAKIQRENTLT